MIEFLIVLVMWLVSIAISWLMIEIHVCLRRWSSGYGLANDDVVFLRFSSVLLGPAFVIYWLYVIFYSFLWNVLKITLQKRSGPRVQNVRVREKTR